MESGRLVGCCVGRALVTGGGDRPVVGADGCEAAGGGDRTVVGADGCEAAGGAVSGPGRVGDGFGAVSGPGRDGDGCGAVDGAGCTAAALGAGLSLIHI